MLPEDEQHRAEHLHKIVSWKHHSFNVAPPEPLLLSALALWTCLMYRV